MTSIYELYGRQAEEHAQEMAKITAAFATTITRLKDGSLTLDNIQITAAGVHIELGKPAEPEANGRRRREAKARTT